MFDEDRDISLRRSSRLFPVEAKKEPNVFFFGCEPVQGRVQMHPTPAGGLGRSLSTVHDGKLPPSTRTFPSS